LKSCLQLRDLKYNALLWACHKHHFALASQMILKGADTFVVTQNQANLLHIVMANFDTDLDNAAELADLLVTSGVQTKQLDRDGKSPLHLAVKKDQVDALIYAADREWNFNTLGRL
jgi:ankyrin repeat protein